MIERIFYAQVSRLSQINNSKDLRDVELVEVNRHTFITLLGLVYARQSILPHGTDQWS